MVLQNIQRYDILCSTLCNHKNRWFIEAQVHATLWRLDENKGDHSVRACLVLLLQRANLNLLSESVGMGGRHTTLKPPSSIFIDTPATRMTSQSEVDAFSACSLMGLHGVTFFFNSFDFASA